MFDSVLNTPLNFQYIVNLRQPDSACKNGRRDNINNIFMVANSFTRLASI